MSILKDIRKNIRSVRITQKITNGMKMVVMINLNVGWRVSCLRQNL